MSEHETQIRDRAHAIWESENRPEGRHVEHWEQANREIGAQPAQTSSVTALEDATASPSATDSGQTIFKRSETRTSTLVDDEETRAA